MRIRLTPTRFRGAATRARSACTQARAYVARSPRVRAALRLLALQTIASAVFFATACTGGVPNPGASVSSGQAMLDLSNELVQLREENAQMQAQIDSMRFVVAYQDTILRQLAALSNVSVRPPSSSVP